MGCKKKTNCLESRGREKKERSKATSQKECLVIKTKQGLSPKLKMPAYPLAYKTDMAWLATTDFN